SKILPTSWAAATRRRTSYAGLAILAVTVVFLAVRAKGYETPEPDLHDGGIWVTNETRRVIGRTNAEIATVDTKLDAGSGAFDLYQSGDIVVIHQHDPPALGALDPVEAVLVPGPELPDAAQVGLGGTTAALLDSSNGELYIRQVHSS